MIKLNNFNSFKEELKQSKIAVIGAGVSNIPLIKYLIKLNCNITLFDNKEFDKLNNDIKDLINNQTINAYLGKDNLTKLKGFNIIFRSPSTIPITIL